MLLLSLVQTSQCPRNEIGEEMPADPSALATTAVVLAGGGIDSTFCMYQLNRAGIRCRAIHVDYGQPSSLYEWKAVQGAAGHLRIPADQLKLIGQLDFHSGEIPGRNAALVFIGHMHMRPTERLLCIGIHAGTPFADCSAPFFRAISKLVAEQTDSRVRLIAPLLSLTKPEVVEQAKALGVRLSETYSCQWGIPQGCGKCHSCKDRKALGC